ncbi:MAG: hypothetical protein IPK56_11225 [Elusimicrobia bacterium]|nr:hypothetical protein [Elusimicrobiota bacterium]
MKIWRHNWELKVLAIVLALFLWWVVHHQDARRPAPAGRAALTVKR